MRCDPVFAARLGVALVVAGLIAGGATVGHAADRSLPTVATVVDVHLAAGQQLPAAVRATMIGEAGDIWRQAGVQLRWEPALPPDRPANAALRVFVLRDARPARARGPQWHVGRLTVDQDDRVVAIASLGAAERALDELGAAQEPVRMRERRLGLILGRAVAHEIGHFLLNGGSHARRGLMRALIPAGDLADLRSSGFSIDAAAIEWIRTRWAGGAAADAAPSLRFAFAR